MEQRHRVEAELRQRIEQLEKRQMQDDAVLNVVNRYWNQLNEDIRVLLQRFDAETADESENKSKQQNILIYIIFVAYNKCFNMQLQMKVKLQHHFLCSFLHGTKRS